VRYSTSLGDINAVVTLCYSGIYFIPNGLLREMLRETTFRSTFHPMGRPPKDIRYRRNSRDGRYMVSYIETPGAWYQSPEADYADAMRWATRNRSRLLADAGSGLTMASCARDIFRPGSPWRPPVGGTLPGDKVLNRYPERAGHQNGFVGSGIMASGFIGIVRISSYSCRLSNGFDGCISLSNKGFHPFIELHKHNIATKCFPDSIKTLDNVPQGAYNR
jgi:hypothetical protein